MGARFKEAKMGYSKAEVDTYIMKLQNEIEQYRFNEVAQEKKLVALRLREVEMKEIATLKAKQIEEDTKKSLYKIEFAVHKSSEQLAAVNKSINAIFRKSLIDFKAADTQDATKYLGDLDYELTRKLYYLKGLSSESENVEKHASREADKKKEKDINFESRTFLQQKSRRKLKKKIALTLFIMVIVFSLFYWFWSSRIEASLAVPVQNPPTEEETVTMVEEKSESIIAGFSDVLEVIESASIRVLEPIYVRKTTETEVDLLKISSKINPDFAFWLQIDNTHLNCPVVQAEDNEFYLHHSFDRSESDIGTIFMDAQHDPLNLPRETRIYSKALDDEAFFRLLLEPETGIETIYTIFEDGVIEWEAFDKEESILPSDRILSLIPADAHKKYILNAKLKKP